MSKMRKIGGYMTVEVSAILPIALMVLWMFFSYLFYFMNCGITQGIMEEATQKAADVRITGADYKTGKISYQKMNQKMILNSMIPSNKNGDTKAKNEIMMQSTKHLFMTKITSAKVSTSPLKVTTKVRTRSNVISANFLEMFGIHLFEYDGEIKAIGNFEIDQMRRWNAIERAMD